MRSHNLATVLAFEVRRTLVKPQFWLASLAVPVLFAAFFALIWVSNTAAVATEISNRARPVTFTYADASGVVRPEVAERLGGRPSTDPAGDADAVRQGRSDLFISYPAEPTTHPVAVVGRDLGLLENSRYTFLATQVLQESARATLGNEELTRLVTRSAAVDAQTWRDGERTPGWAGVIAPGVFVVLLYLTVLMLGNQMLNITVEEKENRVTEMILTTIHPTTLIVGKVVAVLVIGLVQTTVVGLPVMLLLSQFPAVGVALGETSSGTISSADAAEITLPPLDASAFAPWPIALGGLLFVGGLLMFAGLLVAIGSVMPTAKDASGAFGIVVVAMILPLYAAPLIVSQPNGLPSRVLTFFPLTAPNTALLRNATGSIGVVEGLAALAVIVASAVVFLALGVRLFREGSISYGVRLAIPKVLGVGRGFFGRRAR